MRLKQPYIVLLLTVALSISVPCKAQDDRLDNVRFSHLTVQDGLTHSNVNCIVQDQSGFVWFGTRCGLCRYDGHTIKQYFSSESDQATLTNNFVTDLKTASDGRLWIATEGGICSYDPITERFKRYSTGNGEGNSYCVVTLDNGDVYAFVSRSGFYKYNLSSDSFEYVEQQGKKKVSNYQMCYSIAQYRNMIVVGTGSGLLCYNFAENQVVNPFAQVDNNIFTDAHITSIAVDHHDNLYVGTHNRGVAVAKADSSQCRIFNVSNGLNSNIIRGILADGDNIWVANEMGINILTLQKGVFKSIHNDITDVSGLNDNAVYSLFKDRGGNLWAGTYFGGVNIFADKYSNFTYYPSGYSNNHLHGKAVRTIVENNDSTVWVSTDDGGVQLLNRNDRSFADLPTNIKLSYHNIQSMLKDSRGELWVGTFTRGLNRYNINKKTIETIVTDNDGVSLGFVTSMAEDKANGIVWMGCPNGLHKYSHQTGLITHIDHPLLNRHIYTMLLDSSGTLWVGTRRNGIVLYESEDNIYQLHLDDHFNSFITCLFEDGEGNVWIGSNQSGVLKYNPADDTTTRFSIDNGMPSNSVMSINQDTNGTIWVSTVAGLCSISGNTIKSVYTGTNGLPTHQFNYSSSLRCNDGEMFFGTTNGMISFYPDRLKVNRSNPQVALTGMSINGREVAIGQRINGRVVLESSITLTNAVRLSYGQAKLVGLEFTAFDFCNDKFTYQIRMDDSEWQSIGNQRQLTFPNIKQGNHKLMIRAASNGNNFDNAPIRTLVIHVRPPFWLSWPAFVLIIILAALIIYISYRWMRIKANYQSQINNERVQKELEKEVNRRKTEFFTNISHELKTPLTLILSPLKTITAEPDISSKTRYRLELITRNAQRMLSMIDELMTFSKIEMGQGKITLQKGEMMEFFEQMCRVFNIAVMEKNIRFNIDVPDDESKVWFSPRNLETIVYNLLSNSFKFTQAGGTISVSASFREHDSFRYFHLEVADTGIGIPAESIDKIFQNYYMVDPESQKGTGIGLALTQSLVTLQKGKIGVESTQGHGARFTVELNVSAEAFGPESLSQVELDSKSIASYNYAMIDLENKYDNVDVPQSIVEEDKNPVILVVEDNAELNSFISDIFGNRYTVISAFDGKSAYEKVLNANPDVVISDVMMPEMNGLELTERIKNNLATCHISVVLLTAKTTAEDVQEGFGSGADAYIKKPFDARSLELQIDNILQTRRNNTRYLRNMVERGDDEPQEPEQGEITTNSRDKEFIDSVLNFIRDNLSNESLSISDITDHLCISRSLLYMKLKKLIDTSAIELIKELRMEKAKSLLRGGYNISETSYAVGIADPNYFTKCFKKRYGATPSEYLRTISQTESTQQSEPNS